jgi:hypothetical protein
MENIESGYWTSESVEEFFSDEDFWVQPLTAEELAEELAEERRQEARQAREDEIGEMYASQFAFD